MSKKTATADSFIGKKDKLYKDISAIKLSVKEYRAERKESWKLFKHKTNNNIEKIEKSLVGLLTGIKKK